MRLHREPHDDRTDQVLSAPQRLWAAALSPDGERVAAACDDHAVHLFTLDDPEEAFRIDRPDVVRSVGWSPDGDLVGTGCQDAVARVVDAATRDLVHELIGHTGQVRAIRWSPQGHRIATVPADDDLRVWDARTGAPLLRLQGYEQGVCAVDWSRRGDLLLTAANDGTARVWKVGSEPTAVIALEAPATALAWSATSRTLAVATGPDDRPRPDGSGSSPWTAVLRGSRPGTPGRSCPWTGRPTVIS